jgi:putative flavoprotein involved in K+ transport
VAKNGHRTILSGPIRGELPFDLNGRPAQIAFPVLFQLAKHVLTLRTPIGRKIKPEIRAHGGPLLRYKRADLKNVGVEVVAAKTVGVTGGLPTLDGGRVLDVANVIWCTGSRISGGSTRP